MKLFWFLSIVAILNASKDNRNVSNFFKLLIGLIAAVDFLRSAKSSKSLVMLLVQSAPKSIVVSKAFQGHNQALILAAELSKDP